MTDNTNVESKKCKKNYMPQKLKDRAYNFDQTLFKVFGEGKDKMILSMSEGQ